MTGGQQPIGNSYRFLSHFFCTLGNPCATPIVTRGAGSFSYQGVSTKGVRHSPDLPGADKSDFSALCFFRFWARGLKSAFSQARKLATSTGARKVHNRAFGAFGFIVQRIRLSLEWIQGPFTVEHDSGLIFSEMVRISSRKSEATARKSQIQAKNREGRPDGPLQIRTELSGPLRLRVQSRSRTRLRIAASTAFLFRACFKGVLDTIAPLSRG